MDITYLVQLLQNKITILSNAKAQAFSHGDLETLNAVEKELFDTQNTLNQLSLLSSITEAAASVNITPVEMVAQSIEAIQNMPVPVQGPSASASVEGYDLSAYATDTLYEQKIKTIVGGMPVFAEGDSVALDMYIQNAAPGSPVTGDMVLAAVQQFSVSTPLLLAIMQNDSAFGTEGVGARTNNPGNVGNTGTETRAFGTWEEGVMAVAEWLSRHREQG